MRDIRSWVQWLVGPIGAAIALAASCPDASACSCAPTAFVDWPPADATGVAIDTPVVISGMVSADQFQPLASMAEADGGSPSPQTESDASAGAQAAFRLVSASGRSVGLEVARYARTSLCTAGYYFAKPSAELESNTAYELRQGATPLRSFTTGSEHRDVASEKAAAAALTWETLGSAADPKQITTAFVTRLSSAGLYLNFTGSSAEVTYATRWSNNGVAQLDFGSLECPQVDVLGLGGELLLSQSLCQADRCVVLDGTVGSSSCGGNFFVGVGYEQFQQLPLGCASSGTTPPADASTGDPGSANAPTNDTDTGGVAADTAPTDSGPEAGPGMAEPAASEIAAQPEPRKVGVDLAANDASSSSACTVATIGSPASRSTLWSLLGLAIVTLRLKLRPTRRFTFVR